MEFRQQGEDLATIQSEQLRATEIKSASGPKHYKEKNAADEKFHLALREAVKEAVKEKHDQILLAIQLVIKERDEKVQLAIEERGDRVQLATQLAIKKRELEMKVCAN